MILREICNNNTAVELKEIAKNNGLSGYSKMKKAELVELVSNHLMNYDTIEETLFLADDKELSCFEQICKGEVTTLPEEANEYVFFFMRGYLNINNKREVSVADDVKRLVPVVFNEEFQAKRKKFQALLQYAIAGVNLYGIVPVEFLVRFYNANNRYVITEEEFVQVVEKAQSRNCVVELKGQELVHEILMSNKDAYKKLCEKQEGKPYYVPGREELLAYADESYVAKDEHYMKYKSLFTDFMYMNDEMAEQVVDEVEVMFGQGMDAADILASLEKNGLTYKDDFQKQLCFNYTLTYTNHIRLWENRGNTRAELGLGTDAMNVLNFTPSTETVRRAEKKVGRNDPCPCGSGKKYKFCCGRK